jgi:hypothetical protein
VDDAGWTLDVAGDESGYEGEKLVGGTTDVFAHATVVLPATVAAGCVREARDRIKSPATEYKAGHLLRTKNRAVLTWILDPSGPLAGHARVIVVDKTLFLLEKIVTLVMAGVGEVNRSAEAVNRSAAAALYRARLGEADRTAWTSFLLATNDLLRSRQRADGGDPGRRVRPNRGRRGQFDRPGAEPRSTASR